MPHAVESETLVCKARTLQERLEFAAVEVTRVHGFAQSVGEDQLIVLPPVRQGGQLGAQQLISRGWVEESTRVDTSTDPSLDYQYFWWVDTPDDKTSHFSSRGKYGHYIHVAPERDLAIVRLGKEGERGYSYWIELFEELATKLET